ncbi:MAG: hypothetical protein LC793_04835 [Thermomicrobia bacterium]|nr:hypothetical protein [Thermomicrobia bacterium]MCA1724480.1 hypothetical protein [Thermomicrobia bacterium]
MDYSEAQSGGALRLLSHPAPPPWLHDRIVATIRAEASRQHRRHLRHAILGLAALLSLIVMAHGLVH